MGTTQELGIVILVLLIVSLGVLDEYSDPARPGPDWSSCPVALEIDRDADGARLLCLPAKRSFDKLPEQLKLSPECKVPSGLQSGMRLKINSSDKDSCRIETAHMRGSLLLMAGLKIDINQASTSDLISIPGIGEVLAQRIVDHREQHGAFSALDELVEVKGIGPKTLARMQSYLWLKESQSLSEIHPGN